MAYVVVLQNYRPPRRTDDVPFTTALIEEAVASAGPWLGVEYIALDPVDADPAAPAERDLTSALGTLDPAVAWYRVTFADDDGSIAISDPVGPSGYPTTEELVDASAVTELTGASEAQQDTWRQYAISAVEDSTGQVFEPTVETRLLDGTGGTSLRLPKRLETLTALVVRGTSLDLTSVELSERGDELRIAQLSTSYAVRALADDPWADTRTFRLGGGVVAITGTWGWTVVPPAVVDAIRLDMEDQARADSMELADTIAAYRRLGVVGEVSQGNLRFTLGPGGGQLSRTARALLSDYVWVAPGVMV